MTGRQVWGLLLSVIGVAFLLTGVGIVPGGLALIFGIKSLVTQAEENQGSDDGDEAPRKRRTKTKRSKQR